MYSTVHPHVVAMILPILGDHLTLCPEHRTFFKRTKSVLVNSLIQSLCTCCLKIMCTDIWSMPLLVNLYSFTKTKCILCGA